MQQLLRFLGKLGTKVPKLSSQEWGSIFEFLDYFLVVKEDGTKEFINFDWEKVREILMLLDKIQD